MQMSLADDIEPCASVSPHALVPATTSHPQDDERLDLMQRLSRRYTLPLLAAGDVHYHVASAAPAGRDGLCARPLQPARCAGAAVSNGERHLRNLANLQRFYPPELLHETLA